MKITQRIGPALLLAAIAGAAVPASAETVRLHGAASVVDALVLPAKSAVEKATGDTLIIDKSNAGKGLIDLVDGKCDAALASASIDTIVGAAKAAGRDIDGSKLVMAVVKKDEVVFVVHPSNPVQTLTAAQVRDLHSGRVANWKDVGGPDLAVEVVTDTPSSATRGLIKQAVLKDIDYVPTALAVNVETISDEVAKRPGAIGGLGAGFVKPSAVAVVRSDKLERPLGVVTIGPPSPKVQRVIDALKVEAAK